MSDTVQLVQWSLDQNCRLRPAVEDEPSSPDAVLDRVSFAQTYARGLHDDEEDFQVLGDICVTSITYGDRPGGDKAADAPMIPSDGFVVSRAFAPYGGLETVVPMCRACPANTLPQELAQCAGYLEQWPDSPDTEEQLQGIISRLGLAQQVAESFPATKPLWYGLWAVSPVPAASLPLLGLLLAEMLREDRLTMELAGEIDEIDEEQLQQFARVVAAIDIADRRGIPLRVGLMPLGHTDFGVYTIFPHCPFCKAAARTARWQERYPAQLHTCQVCGTRFSPAETATSRRMKWDREGLREQLGEEAFDRLTRDYLLARGEAPEALDGIMSATAASQRRMEENNLKRIDDERRSRDYLEQHVYHGIPRVEAPPSEFMDGDEEEEQEPDSNNWFDAGHFGEVLQRCETLGIKITVLIHRSRNHLNNHVESPGRRAGVAMEIFTRWRAEGCDGKFFAGCRVPVEMLG